ncbi:hypothetical protein YC2023_061697 [Brassica napus]
MSNDIVIKLPSSFLGAIDGAQTIPEKIAVIQGYLKKLEDAKKERAEWRKQLEERANRLQEQRDALRDRRKQIEDEKREIEDQKRAIAERRKATMTDDQKKALDDEEKAVEEREKINQEREKETEDQENATEDQVKEVEIQKKHAEDVDPAQEEETILLSTTFQNLVDSSAPLPPPATASPTVPSGFPALTPSNPTAATSSSGPSTSHTLASPAPSESSLPAAPTLPRPPSSFNPFQPPQQTSEIALTSPAFATLPIFQPHQLFPTRIFWTDQLTQAFDEVIQSLGGLNKAIYIIFFSTRQLCANQTIYIPQSPLSDNGACSGGNISGPSIHKIHNLESKPNRN